MTEQKPNIFLVRTTLVLLSLISLAFIINIGQDIIVPIAFSVCLAILLLPMNRYMEKKRIDRIPAILISILLALLVLTIIIYFFTQQIANFVNDIPLLKKQVNHHLITIQRWIYTQFHLTKLEQTEYFNKATSEIGDNKTGFIGQTFLTITNSIFFLVLLPIYTFLVLYYRDMIKKFLIDLFPRNNKEDVVHVITASRTIINGYMVGLLIEMGIITTINYVGFLVIGIKYALFLSVFTAILNMIPYIGMLIASILCMLITASTSTEIMDVVWVLAVLVVVQFFDNNILMPKIVSSKIKINAMATIIGVLVGGALAGVSGMFLSIPFIAIMKTICDRVPELKPWGEILGDEITIMYKGRLIKKFVKPKAPKNT
ncbi:AI-2E family transporter [soil metagenome]